MHRFTVINHAGADLPAGVIVGLTDDQARRRGHLLEEADAVKRGYKGAAKKMDRRFYRATGRVFFKNGEEFLLASTENVHKGVLAALEDTDALDAARAEEEAERKAAEAEAERKAAEEAAEAEAERKAAEEEAERKAAEESRGQADGNNGDGTGDGGHTTPEGGGLV